MSALFPPPMDARALAQTLAADLGWAGGGGAGYLRPRSRAMASEAVRKAVGMEAAAGKETSSGI